MFFNVLRYVLFLFFVVLGCFPVHQEKRVLKEPKSTASETEKPASDLGAVSNNGIPAAGWVGISALLVTGIYGIVDGVRTFVLNKNSWTCALYTRMADLLEGQGKHLNYNDEDVLVYVAPAQGGGDVYLGVKTAEAIYQQTKKSVLLYIAKGDMDIALPEQKSLPKGVRLLPQDIAEVQKTAQLVVALPSGAMSAWGNLEKFPSQKFVCMAEYNLPTMSEILQKRGWDVFIDSGIGFKRTEGMLGRIFKTGKKYDGIFWLKDQQIQEIKNRDLGQMVELQRLDANVRSALEAGNYYFAYLKAKEEVNRALFIKSVWEAQDPATKVLYFVMPGSLRLIESIFNPDYIYNFDQTNEMGKLSLQLGKVRLISLETGNEKIIQKDNADIETFILHGGVGHELFVTLMAHTRFPYVGITGDQ